MWYMQELFRTLEVILDYLDYSTHSVTVVRCVRFLSCSRLSRFLWFTRYRLPPPPPPSPSPSPLPSRLSTHTAWSSVLLLEMVPTNRTVERGADDARTSTFRVALRERERKHRLSEEGWCLCVEARAANDAFCCPMMPLTGRRRLLHYTVLFSNAKHLWRLNGQYTHCEIVSQAMPKLRNQAVVQKMN